MKGKNYIVTGGGGKVGSAICKGILQKGGNVVSLGRSFPNKRIKEANNYIEVKCDVASEDDFTEVLSEVLQQYGSVHGLVNCTSYRPMRKYMDDTIRNWEKSISINSLALFVPTRAIINYFIKERIKGSIVTVSSMYGSVSPQSNLYRGCNFETEPDYVYNKSAAIGFTRFIGCKYACHNIRANIVTPGGFFNNQPPNFIENYESIVPMGRMATKDDIMGVVSFLLSEDSSYITGAVIPVDGGWTGI